MLSVFTVTLFPSGSVGQTAARGDFFLTLRRKQPRFVGFSHSSPMAADGDSNRRCVSAEAFVYSEKYHWRLFSNNRVSTLISFINNRQRLSLICYFLSVLCHLVNVNKLQLKTLEGKK